jgi:Fe-S-cluster containining protein
VWVTRAEVAALAKHKGVEPGEFGRRYLRKVGGRYSLVEKENGECVFFERGCTVYAARPRQCRTFPFWPEVLASRSAWDETASKCPGAGRGRLYSAQEIDRIRRGDGSAAAV